MAFPVTSVKSLFPIFTHWPALVYLDSAATSQKPQEVVNAISRFYEKQNASVHRGLYELSSKSTSQYEAVRKKVADLIKAKNPQSIAFTKGTTESINTVAHGFLEKKLETGDSVVISEMEHHANLIPWQQLCKKKNAKLKVIPVNTNGELKLEALHELLDSSVRMLAVTHVSNVLGTVNPIDEIIEAAHQKKIPVLVDAAQSAGHHPIDVNQWDVDFLVFSAHKMFGPLGTGVLYCKEDHFVEAFNYGGGSIKNVTIEETEFMDYPHNLEAGTPNISGVIGLGAAIDFLKDLDMKEALDHVVQLNSLLKEKLISLGFIILAGKPMQYGAITSFQVNNIHAHDVAGFLAHQNIAVRAGHHCAQPLLDALSIPATVRASFSIYNTKEDVSKLSESLVELKKFWS